MTDPNYILDDNKTTDAEFTNYLRYREIIMSNCLCPLSLIIIKMAANQLSDESTCVR